MCWEGWFFVLIKYEKMHSFLGWNIFWKTCPSSGVYFTKNLLTKFVAFSKFAYNCYYFIIQIINCFDQALAISSYEVSSQALHRSRVLSSVSFWVCGMSRVWVYRLDLEVSAVTWFYFTQSRCAAGPYPLPSRSQPKLFKLITPSVWHHNKYIWLKK